MMHAFQMNGERVDVAVRRDPAAPDRLMVTVGSATHAVRATRMADGTLHVSYDDGRRFKAVVDRDSTNRGLWWLTLNGHTHRIQEDDGEGAHTEEGTAAEAPMPGKVLEVRVHPGQRVQAGDVLMIVEAMKMEHPLKASRDATVGEVKADVGDMVKPGRALVIFEEPNGA